VRGKEKKARRSRPCIASSPWLTTSEEKGAPPPPSSPLSRAEEVQKKPSSPLSPSERRDQRRNADQRLVLQDRGEVRKKRERPSSLNAPLSHFFCDELEKGGRGENYENGETADFFCRFSNFSYGSPSQEKKFKKKETVRARSDPSPLSRGRGKVCKRNRARGLNRAVPRPRARGKREGDRGGPNSFLSDYQLRGARKDVAGKEARSRRVSSWLLFSSSSRKKKNRRKGTSWLGEKPLKKKRGPAGFVLFGGEETLRKRGGRREHLARLIGRRTSCGHQCEPGAR